MGVVMDGPFDDLLRSPRDAPVALLHSGGGGRSTLLTEACDELIVGPADADDAWARLDSFLSRHRGRCCVGWFGYDLRDASDAIPLRIAADLALPLAHVVAFARRSTWRDAAASPAPPLSTAARTRVHTHTTRADFEARIAAVVEHIRAGDIFQANLTQPFTGAFAGDPRLLFWRACAVSPAPFAAYLEFDRRIAVLSASPEEFLRVRDRMVETRPIKGTRPRGRDPSADHALLAELLASDKDRAELAMIVDLMRNDLGKVAAVGSVDVGPFPEHASFAHVHHTFACVRARLRPEVTFGDLMAATFPPGSVTGAPKLRAMEILEELELVRRGVYTGAIGWFGPGDACHLNVAIRTLTLVDGLARFNAGGGITARSDPHAEYDECLHKAVGWLRALGAELDGP
ncbi:MAG: aminodeoxychorismate synthase component I [Planctomycetota bacterium]